MLQNLLLIDDSAAIHSLVRARLKDEPIQIHCASGGQQGLEMAAAIVPDVILVDIEMPDLNGLEVCRQLKLNEKLAAIPVILLTGVTSGEQRLRGLEAGAADYISKPFDPAELRARVRASLRMKFMIDLLANKAQIDALTGLWNRRYFQQRLETELSLARRAQRPLAVVMLDLDHFKTINDRFGHPAGDELLRQISTTLADSLRLEDILCRWSGEKFAIVTPIATEGAVQLAERLRHILQAKTFTVAGRQLQITASLGIAGCARQPSYALVEQAEAALAAAKQAGRNCVRIAEAVQEQTVAA